MTLYTGSTIEAQKTRGQGEISPLYCGSGKHALFSGT